MAKKSVAARLDKLEQQAGKGNQGVAFVDGIGKTQEEIDEEVAKLRAEGHRGVILIMDA